MRQRAFVVRAVGLLLIAAAALVVTPSVSASSPSLARTFTVGFKYVTVYKNRLTNAQAAVNQMQQFFDKVEWKQGRQYSFLRDIMHQTIDPNAGYVNTPLGFGYGSCGASSLLNKLVKTAMFRDSDGQEKPVFLSIMVWTWRGDKTYGQYGATIYIDTTGHHTLDYVWRLNPAYDGPPPTFTSHFDMEGKAVDLKMDYGDEAAALVTSGATAAANNR